MIQRTLIGMLAAVALGCGCTGTTLTGYDFETSAVYVADKSGITLELHAKGAVAPGEDVGTGDVVGTIRLRTSAADAISFETTAGKLTELVCRSGKARIASPDGAAASFTACLGSMGYSGVDAAEMEELVKVIEGAAAGPKGTYMKGQTRHLRVEKTEFVRR
jgi:hypothetical protein